MPICIYIFEMKGITFSQRCDDAAALDDVGTATAAAAATATATTTTGRRKYVEREKC